jgi:hypothetical protein
MTGSVHIDKAIRPAVGVPWLEVIKDDSGPLPSGAHGTRSRPTGPGGR